MQVFGAVVFLIASIFMVASFVYSLLGIFIQSMRDSILKFLASFGIFFVICLGGLACVDASGSENMRQQETLPTSPPNLYASAQTNDRIVSIPIEASIIEETPSNESAADALIEAEEPSYVSPEDRSVTTTDSVPEINGLPNSNFDIADNPEQQDTRAEYEETPSNESTVDATAIIEEPPYAGWEEAKDSTITNDISNNRVSTGNNFNIYDNAQQQQTDKAYVLNTNTMKIHHPDCRDVRKIAPQNYMPTDDSLEQLMLQEYSKCGHCFK